MAKTRPTHKYGMRKTAARTDMENESGRSTSKVTQLPNQSVSYGLFQINSKNWCRKGRKGGICNIKCEGK
uniref:Lysozyme n=1 Tax=Glossina austeni TaxID=7395 RepID=A0A1A9V9Y4_GLOAU